ncbi:MAG TPA: YhdH/YhfP family quinone oxidoreductase [Gracilimonas sp.]|uniref:YhdH/YhfP family quinone oxidoreductase n=1 Tax=Gracilimonas sp. TaxID=1974203 RepID=UPI002D9F4F20|nr:YhdH/YhfP family quinone oxidoreductase [Gracilimonas sp.]
MDKKNIEMKKETFKAFLVKEKSGGNFVSDVTEVPVSFLPEHEVMIEVKYSSLNYKDALSASGNKGVTRNYPHIPGVDAAGVVLEDASGNFAEGQKVIVTGQDLGSNTPGGFGSLIRVPKEWVVALPDGLDLETSMKYGTAGFTAMYGVKRLERESIGPEDGKVLVTGATGGVGSLAVFFLAESGYKVIAATGKMDKADFLKKLGASEVIHRKVITEVKDSFLLSREWNGAIETVGGEMLDAVIRQTNHDGAVACCGNILGHDLNTSIYPFILRGVSLLGIDSAICKMPMRLKIWDSIAEIEHNKLPEHYARKVGLNDLQKEVDIILKGGQTGRVVVEH